MSDHVHTHHNKTLSVSNTQHVAQAAFDERATTSVPNDITVPDIVQTLHLISAVAAPHIYATHIFPVAGEHISTEVCNVFVVTELTVTADQTVGVVPETVTALVSRVVQSQYATVKAFVSCLHTSRISPDQFMFATILVSVPHVIVSQEIVHTLQYKV